jgi:hypothetical protein
MRNRFSTSYSIIAEAAWGLRQKQRGGYGGVSPDPDSNHFDAVTVAGHGCPPVIVLITPNPLGRVL